jgi:hypothetical protein
MWHRNGLMGSVVVTTTAVLFITACSNSTPRSTTETIQSAEPTPNIGATVQAAVSATTGAIAATSVAAAQPVQVVPTIAPPQPPPTAVPTVAIKPDVRVPVPEFDTYTDSIGGTVVVGMVKNEGRDPAANIDIAFSLLDADGATVGAGSAFVKPSILQPGDSRPWSGTVSGGSAFKEIKVQAQAGPLTTFAAAFATQAFTLTGVTTSPPKPPFNTPAISGQATNDGSQGASLIQIVAAIYTPDGKLFDVRYTSAKLQELSPGQSSPFEISFLGGRKTTGDFKYDLFAQGIPTK